MAISKFALTDSGQIEFLQAMTWAVVKETTYFKVLETSIRANVIVDKIILCQPKLVHSNSSMDLKFMRIFHLKMAIREWGLLRIASIQTSMG
jgi:hypothetical protein